MFNIIAAPPSVAIERITPDSVVVQMEAPEDEPWIEKYEAFIKGGTEMQRCIVKVCVMPLQCQINHLNPYTSYTIEVRSCVPGGNACSSAVEKSFTTQIRRTFTLIYWYFTGRKFCFELNFLLLFYSPSPFIHDKRNTLVNESGNTGPDWKCLRHFV